MFKKKGFTLLEVLIVVVIAVSVTAFAVPAYKKMQIKARYNAAAGVLVQMGNAVKNLRDDLRSENPSKHFPIAASSVTFSSDWSDSSKTNYQTAANAATLSALTTNDLLGYALVARGYMPAFPSTDNKIGGYSFYICPELSNGIANSLAKCCYSTDVVVCMAHSGTGLGEYYYGRFMKNGMVEHSAGLESTAVAPVEIEGPKGPVVLN